MSTIIDCNMVEVFHHTQYRHFTTPVPFHLIPVRLANRLEIKMVDPVWFNTQLKGWGDELRINLSTVGEVTGLDKFYWVDGGKCFTLAFKPLVGLKTVMGEGFIESFDPEVTIENTPVIDFDYQDAGFDSELDRLQSIIRSINY